MRELSAIANNMANSSTSGFKREGAVFAEYVQSLDAQGPTGGEGQSLSIGHLAGHVTDFSSGSLRQTGASFDIALQNDGFFTVNTDAGERLTRAGHFFPDDQGILVNPDGYRLTDQGGGEIQVPFDANQVVIGRDGTISADGIEVARIGVQRADLNDLSRAGDNLWTATRTEPVENPDILQGYLEGSNVQPMIEIARMIEVQRHYDAGTKLLELDHERLSKTITTIRQIG